MPSLQSSSHTDSLEGTVDLSIVIVNYNVREFLQHCLESIRRSTHTLRIEVLVVDNNSHDNSVELLSPKFNEVEFIALNENLGFGRANNIGIERARGRYVLLLNPDTILQEDTLQRMAEYMDTHPDVGISGCKVLNADGSFQAQCRRGFPSPWASFCKLFGLQAMFPNSPLFARYNQSFRSEDETYTVDAVIGAFMFCRRDALLSIQGFDPDFFMYGEDLDLCYRMKLAGFNTAYVPITTIIHFKGESTRRSSMNEVKIFYEAMEIFAHKHYSTSRLFLLFLKSGIRLRSLLAYLLRHKRSVVVLILDLITVLCTFLVAVKLRRGDYFALPSYAFPTVFIAIPLVVILCMLAVGEYFEYRPTIRRAAVGLLLSFFALSSLTYYWNEYAFSRGVLLMTIGFSAICLTLIRIAVALFDRVAGDESERRLVLVGSGEEVQSASEHLTREHALHINIVGAVYTDLGPGQTERSDAEGGLKALGHIDYLAKVIESQHVDEVIILGDEQSYSSLMSTMRRVSDLGVRFHIASDVHNVVALGIAERISSKSALSDQYRILSFRVRILRRLIDILGAFCVLFILSPVVILIRQDRRARWNAWWKVLWGSMSIVGLYPPSGDLGAVAKEGITGLAHISHPQELRPQTVQELNLYYVRNYRPSFDVDIVIKTLFSHR